VRHVVAALAALAAASGAGGDGAAVDGAVRRFVSAAGRHVEDAVATLRALRPELGRDVAAGLDRLAARGDLDDLGPQLDGGQVQRVLGIPPGPEVGEALAFLQRLRWDEGTLPGDAVRERLRQWWSARAAPA
jgi:poly(A) polymerase